MQLHTETLPSEERDAAAWLAAAGLPGTGAGVASFVPRGFEAYARILHPARVGDRVARWSEIAGWAGHELRRDSDSKDLLVRADGTRWDELPGHQPPGEGTSGLDPDGCARLGALLAAATTTPDDVWTLFDVIQYHLPDERSGYTSSPRRQGRLAARAAERRKIEAMRALEERSGIVLAGHRFILHRGRLSEDGPAGPLLPAYSWPADRAWLVHTNVDCPTTYVAGSGRLVDRLLTDDLLEVVEAHLDDPFDGHRV